NLPEWSRSSFTVLRETGSQQSSALMCLRLLRLSVIVSQSYRTAASSPRAPHKNCEKRRVFPIPGLRMSFSNSPEPRESKILLRPCGDENPCTAQRSEERRVGKECRYRWW